MDILLAIHWNVDPAIFEINGFGPRWYGLMFASGFLLGYLLTDWVFKRENLDQKWLDSLLIYLVVGTVLGARLGHVFFYQWDYYADHLLEIPMVWKGGLASHGGVIGVITALILWSRKVSKKPPLWIMDRLAMQVSLAACCIRLGNLFNSEIVGKTTDVAWAFEFVRHDGPGAPGRHPVQLYEALAYLALAGILFYFYKKGKATTQPGFQSGLMLMLLFIARFVLEFFKAEQIEREAEMALNMGHWLSIPVIVASLGLLLWSYWKKKQKGGEIIN